jgi:hypothetical protein
MHPRDSLARLAARDTLYSRARRELVDSVGPQLRTISPRGLERIRLDNAALLAHRIYTTDLDLFDQLWVQQAGDLRRTVATIISAAEKKPKEPFAAIRAALRQSRSFSLAFQAPNLPLSNALRSIAGDSIGARTGAAGAPASCGTTRCIFSRSPRSMNRDN